ncbi:hypothetical protein V7152_16550 [Neobacillus drentensis]|uniref:hypothetical protein n=1 Tax=Neobacillus drentensis TaxID=220684 RepID=UPI002FFE3C99
MGLDKFSAALDLLKGFHVNLYVGEDIFKGKLIGVEADHVVLETENQYIFYYNIDKIQAITKNTKLFKPEKTKVHFQKTQSLSDLLHSFQHSWVTILTINKQKFSGVLSEIDTEFATLISGEEQILIKLTHVSNILKGFIKEETAKSSSSKDNEKNKDSDNKKDSKDHSSSSGDKKDSKNHSSSSGDKEGSKKDKKSKSESKDECNSSDKKQKSEKSDKKQEAAIKEEYVEPNNTMVWSQPIKIESTMVQTKDEIYSGTFKTKKSQTEEKDSSKNSTEMKKVKDDMSTKDKKSDEAKSSKSKDSDQSKEMKQVKEAVTFQKTDNQPAPPYKVRQNEAKSTKTQETSKAAKSATTQNQATKKTDNKTNEIHTNNTNQNVRKQKEQEQQVIRFTGEPVTRDSQRAFPFSGWPNRNNRTSRL